MDYKIGDKVRIKDLDWYNTNKDEDGDVPCDLNILFIKKMKKYCGKVLTISVVHECIGGYEGKFIYEMEGVKNIDWTEDMIDSKVIEIDDPNKIRKRTGNTFCFKSKRFLDKNEDYQKGYNDAIEKIVEFLKEEELTNYISSISSGVCSITFNNDELIEDLRQKMEE